MSLSERIKEAAQKVGGERSLAALVSASESQVYRYSRGANSPSVEALVEIAQAADVSLVWLATGEGVRDIEPAGETHARQEAVATQAVEIVIRIIIEVRHG